MLALIKIKQFDTMIGFLKEVNSEKIQQTKARKITQHAKSLALMMTAEDNTHVKYFFFLYIYLNQILSL